MLSLNAGSNADQNPSIVRIYCILAGLSRSDQKKGPSYVLRFSCFFFSSCSIWRPSESSRSCIASVIKVETQRRVVSRWSTLVIARNHGNACLFGVLLVTEARTRRVKRVGFWGHWMQRRVVKGPEVKDALADFKKLGQRRSSIIQRSLLATFRNV